MMLRNLLCSRIPTNLDNCRREHPRTESEDNMPINKKKIRREVIINDVKIWVTADNEQDYVNKIIRLAGKPVDTTKTKHPFDIYAKNWFEVFSKPNVSTVTANNYERQLRNYILPALGNLNIEDIIPADVQKIFTDMPSDTKQETKKKVKIVLNQIFKMAVDDEIINRNPLQAKAVKIKGMASEVTQPYDVEQMKFLVAHLDDIRQPMDRLWLSLSLSLPLRPEEVLGLRWGDIDIQNCTVSVHSTVTHPTRNAPEFKIDTKTEASKRTLVFPRELLRYFPEPGKPDEFLIGGEKPISYTKLRGIRRRIMRDTQFNEPIVPRRFRTTVATDISATTHDLKLVQQTLGHSTPQMTLKHYDKGRNKAVDASKAIEKCYGIGG